MPENYEVFQPMKNLNSSESAVCTGGGASVPDDKINRLARNFAAEWLRPNDPDRATEALVDTLSTAMLAFHACARGVEERARAVVGAPVQEENAANEA